MVLNFEFSLEPVSMQKEVFTHFTRRSNFEIVVAVVIIEFTVDLKFG